MHPNDIIISVLTLGTPSNPNSKVFRDLGTLASFTGMAPADVLGILHGDLANLVVCKPSKKKLGQILVALKTNVPKKIVAEDGPVKIKALPVEQAPAPEILNVMQENAPAPADVDGVCEDEDCSCHEDLADDFS